MTDFPDLSDLPPEGLERLLAAGRPRRFSKGEVVFHAGDPGDTLHLIKRGRLLVYRTIGTGQRAVVGFLRAGDVFGEVALFSSGPIGHRSATVEALQPTETTSVSRERFAEIRHEYPELADSFLRLLAARVLRLDLQLTEALLAPAEVRVRRRLAALARQWGSEQLVEVPLTQDELAHAAGTSRATSNKVLREAEEAGLIRLARRRIEIVDLDGLEAIDRLVGWE